MPDSPAREQSDVTGSLVLAGCVHGYYGGGFFLDWFQMQQKLVNTT